MFSLKAMFSNVTPKKLILCFSIIGVVILGAIIAEQSIPEAKNLHWWSIIPSMLAIALAMLTHRIISSLIISVVVGSLLAQDFSLGANYVYKSVSDTTNLLILVFVILLLPSISIVFASGGIQRLLRSMAKNVNSPRSAQFITFLLGLAIFIDDYANTMLVGSTMRPLSDRFRVSREKLSFLVDSTSAPVAGLAVLSTWVGYEVGLFDQVAKSLGIPMDGYNIFLEVIGFRFYCILMIVFVAFNVLMRKEFGPMLKAESLSLFSESAKNPLAQEEQERDGPVWAALLPIFMIFGSLIFGLYLDSGVVVESWSFDSIRQILSESNSTKVLAYSGALGFISAVLCSLAAKMKVEELWQALKSGLIVTATPVAILVLAWSLKASCDALSTSDFLVSSLQGRVNPMFFPITVFIIAGITAFSTGTSWGTMAILLPTIIPVAFSLDNEIFGITTMMSFAAVLDGSIFGDHCSPISDTTIMSSTASQCDHISHVRTQMPYALFVAGVSCVFGYVLRAAGSPLWLCYLSATLVIVASLYFFGKRPSAEILRDGN